MIRRFICCCALVALSLMLLGSLNSVKAQTVSQPDAIIDAVIKDLGQRLGKSLNRHNVDTWAWEQDIFPDASLGCPKPGQTYAQVNTRGFKITVTYLGVVYDYRVSDDGQMMILCTNGAPVGVSTPIPTNPPAPTPIPTVVNVAPASYQSPLAYVGTDGNVYVTNLGKQPGTAITTGAQKPGSGGNLAPQTVNLYYSLRWSPDGSKLLYADKMTRSAFVATSGQKPMQIASSIAPGYPVLWSTDGSSIIYAVLTQETDANNHGSIAQLQAVPATGGQAHVVGQINVGQGGCGGGGSDPSYALYGDETALNGNFLTLAATDKGFVASENCTGVGIRLTDPTGKVIWANDTLGRVQLAPDGKRALAAVMNTQDASPQSLVIVNLADGTTTPVATQPGLDQFGWSTDNNSIFYSTRTDKQTFGDPTAMQAFEFNVTLWIEPTLGGDPVKLFSQRGFGIGTVTTTPDNRNVVYTFIPSSAKLVQAQSSGQTFAQVQGLFPKTQLMAITLDMDLGMVPKTVGEGRSVSIASGTFSAISAGPVVTINTGLTVGSHAVVIVKAGDTLNLRKSPSTTALVLRVLKPGATVTILAGPQITLDGLTWWQVKSDDDGAIGWAVDQVTGSDGVVEQTLASQ